MALLEVENLCIAFHTRQGVVRAVDGVSFHLEPGESLGIVGESGSGKSVLCLSLLGLLPSPPARIEGGAARFRGEDLLALPQRRLRALRGDRIAMVFQDPMTSLNPFLTVGEQLIEPLLYHRGMDRRAARARAVELLGEVGIAEPERRFHAYPHQFSGGMRQRVMIAMALIAEPDLLICDEPTTALDVTVQAQILALLRDLRARRGVALIFVTHDLAVAAEVTDRLLVMRDGRTEEQGPTRAVLARPRAAYTRQLLAAVPRSAKAPAPPDAPAEPLLAIADLRVRYRDRTAGRRRWVEALRGVSLEVKSREIVGLVGESGSGKSTLGRAVLNLVPATGSVRFAGTEILGLDARRMRPFRRRLQMIFQDPYASLDPRMTVYEALAEPLLLHGLADRRTVAREVLALMDDVGLARRWVRKYPHEFSGGQRQRIAIARALAVRPELVVADEPVSALDVTIQAQILELLLDLVARRALTLLFISHDLGVVRYLADRIAVLYRGELVEEGPAAQVWSTPRAEYTRRLLAAVPHLPEAI
ncbi:MAG: ABC transporter ATP-binding protein [Porticoccaceae bacterium]|nr:MAG: ABC transporter ATP-binding protein [Porticoccaceae bacterium]